MPQIRYPNCGLTINLKNRNKEGVGIKKQLSNIRFNSKIQSVLFVILLMIGSPVVGYALAAFLAPHSQAPQEPIILGQFTTVIEIHDVKDLYAWQVVISFNSSELEVLEIASGGFVGDEFPTFVHDLDVENSLLFLGGSMRGPVAGRDGCGVLARVTFGYFVKEYAEPEIVPKGLFFETLLLDSQLSEIPILDSTLQLKMEQHNE